MRKALVLLMIMLLAACQGEQDTTYKQISQEEAMRIMEEEEGYLIVDVRTEEEFQEGHIPDAINIPVESITDERPSQLNDLKQVLLIYCRSGNRSKQAAEKLAAMGYVNILEFGGINTWKGEIVKE